MKQKRDRIRQRMRKKSFLCTVFLSELNKKIVAEKYRQNSIFFLLCSFFNDDSRTRPNPRATLYHT